MIATCYKCGRSIHSKVCGRCGKPSPPNVGIGLLRHCERQLIAVEAKMERITASLAPREMTAFGRRKLENCRGRVAKWKDWVEFLRGTIDTNDSLKNTKQNGR